jgi:hypothetical protein
LTASGWLRLTVPAFSEIARSFAFLQGHRYLLVALTWHSRLRDAVFPKMLLAPSRLRPSVGPERKRSPAESFSRFQGRDS